MEVDDKGISREKDVDRLSFSLSEDDTADSLDIKPPQAAVIIRKTVKHKKEKLKYTSDRRTHGHSSREGSSHRKAHHHSERVREHKDKTQLERSHRDKSGHYRDQEFREKQRGHRERHERIKEARKDEMGKKHAKNITVLDDERSADQLVNDLRDKLLDRRGIREVKYEMTDEPEKKKMKKDRKGRDEREHRREPDETPKERAERMEREERRAKLLEADREMERRKEVSKRELEARRERLQLEKKNEKALKEIALKNRVEVEEVEKEEGEAVESERSDVDDDSSDSSSSSDSELETSDATDEDVETVRDRTPDSIPPLAKSPDRVRQVSTPFHSEEEELPEENHNLSEEKQQLVSDSPMSDVVTKEDILPPYLPAIQGCRSVEEFQCLNRIEEGTYGVVYRALDKRTQDIVALKRLKMEKEKEGFPITSLREINTLLKAQHPNIVTVREIVVGSNMDKIFIVMDYVEHDLKSLMETMKQKKQVFLPGEVKCLMQQLLRAVAHLHDNWILHRDLKTSNLLLSHKGILKVGDFGLAREYGSPLKQYTPVVVTLWYRAPELLLQSKEYSTAIDMWSVGCIFAELLQMEALFCGRSDMDQLNKIFNELGTPNEKIWPGYSKLPATQKVTFAEYPVNQIKKRFGSRLTELGIDLMNKFLTYDPAQRVTAEKALKHLYFAEAPLPIDPAMFPTWPAKSEEGHKKVKSSPKPPSGGKAYKQLGDTDDDVSTGRGFHMGGAVERRANAVGPGFSLKF